MLGFFWGAMNSMLHISSEKISLVEVFVMRIPFSVLAGWVTAATILNISIFLSIDILPNQSEVWAIIILIVAQFIYGAVVFLKKDVFYGFVFLWVLWAISSRNQHRNQYKALDWVIIILNGI